MIFLASSPYQHTITKEYVECHGDEDTWSEATAKDYEANARAQYALRQVLNDDDLSRVINCKSAYEVWNDLIISDEGTVGAKAHHSSFDDD